MAQSNRANVAKNKIISGNSSNQSAHQASLKWI